MTPSPNYSTNSASHEPEPHEPKPQPPRDAMSNRIEFVVYGQSQPAGSKRGFAFKRKNGSTGVAISDANPESRNWKNEVSHAARQVYRGELLRGPLAVTFTFYRPRPKGHFGKRGINKNGLEMPYPISKPDVLKLSRGVEDALTNVVWADDSQIVTELIEKRYGEPARVEIVIGVITEQPEPVTEPVQ